MDTNVSQSESLHSKPPDEEYYSQESPQKDPHEIESGVEMLENMIMPNDGDIKKTKSVRMDLIQSTENNHDVDAKSSSQIISTNKNIANQNPFHVRNLLSRGAVTVYDTLRRIPYYSIFGLVLVMSLQMPDFLRGVLACMLTSSVLGSSWQLLIEIISNASPERSKFSRPNFMSAPIFEIPAVEEIKTVKSYVGWMNEINNYDPIEYHVSMTDSVYVKLDGTTLTVSNTTARIPKRTMWNEKLIDPKHIIFIKHRTYDLLGCRVDLLPLGLASKRFFNRKYPIQLIIKHPCVVIDAETNARDDFFDVKDSDFSIMPDFVSGDRLQQSSKTSLEGAKDFGATIMNADLQALQNTELDAEDIPVPCGDETRLLLFSRGAREKEDWYRRFLAASSGEVDDKDLRLPNMRLVDDSQLQEAAAKSATPRITPDDANAQISTGDNESEIVNEDAPLDDGEDGRGEIGDTVPDDAFDGLVLSSCSSRNPIDFIRFMTVYQNACNQTKIPVYRKQTVQKKTFKRSFRRTKRREDELWKGIDQSLFLGPSGSLVWFNVLVGRFIYSLLNDEKMLTKIQELVQKKIGSIKLPSFMEDVIISQMNLGDSPPLIHRISRPLIDERGIWVDADVTYEGLLHFTVTTKLNLMRLRKQDTKIETNAQTGAQLDVSPTFTGGANTLSSVPDEMEDSSSSSSLREFLLNKRLSGGVIYDSEAESMGSSSTESDDFETDGTTAPLNTSTSATSAATTADAKNTEPNSTAKSQPLFKKNPHKILKIVDRFAASNFFQYATELPYIQRAIENMNANITLKLEVRGMVARVVINMPPPPSDRIWIGFRGPPRLWLQAKPALGEKSVDWSFITSVIETKICEQINKIMVYPNMVDIALEFLGRSANQHKENEKKD